jgi:hypothetical protein
MSGREMLKAIGEDWLRARDVVAEYVRALRPELSLGGCEAHAVAVLARLADAGLTLSRE